MFFTDNQTNSIPSPKNKRYWSIVRMRFFIRFEDSKEQMKVHSSPVDHRSRQACQGWYSHLNLKNESWKMIHYHSVLPSFGNTMRGLNCLASSNGSSQ